MHDLDSGGTAPDECFGPPGSRFAAVSRRTFLSRLTGLGAAALVGLTACGHDDAEVFARGPATTGGTTGTARPGASTSTGVVPTTARGTASSSPPSSTPPSSTAPTTASTAPPASGGAVSGSMAVRFTYQPASSGRRVNNPYAAVWVEDSAGELVDTLGLWYQQGSRGTRYLNELRRWSSVDGSTADTVSSATRTPGDYALSWSLTDNAGKTVAPGSYFLCIEAAREHGPYSLIRQPFTLGTGPFTTDLPAQGELTNASISYPA